jgi:hypothetical protein
MIFMDNENARSEEKTAVDLNENTKIDNGAPDNKVKEAKEEIKNNVTSENERADKNNTNESEPDLSKVKVGNVLAYKIRKCNPKVKKVIAAVLLGVICFGAGIASDRVFLRHELRDGFNGKYQMRQNMPGNFKGNRNFNQGKNKNQNSNNTTQAPSSGQPQN